MDDCQFVHNGLYTQEKNMSKNGIVAMSYNIRYNTEESEGGETRMHTLLSQVLTVHPDILGVQEETPKWRRFLANGLSEIYERVGEGRYGEENEKEYNEAMGIYYKKERFSLVHTVTRWLSHTPDIPTRLGENWFPRCVSFALLQDKMTGERLVYANTHWDVSYEDVRTEEAEILLHFREGFGDVPFLVGGDFNMESTEDAYTRLCHGGLRDASLLAEKCRMGPTFHGYGELGVIIDYFFVSSDICVDGYEVLNEKYQGIYASDHYPIVLTFDLKKKSGDKIC